MMKPWKSSLAATDLAHRTTRHGCHSNSRASTSLVPRRSTSPDKLCHHDLSTAEARDPAEVNDEHWRINSLKLGRSCVCSVSVASVTSSPWACSFSLMSMNASQTMASTMFKRKKEPMMISNKKYKKPKTLEDASCTMYMTSTQPSRVMHWNTTNKAHPRLSYVVKPQLKSSFEMDAM